MSIKTILVPVGGGKTCITALKRAFVIANRFGGHIKGLHVMERASDAATFEMGYLPDNLRNTVQSSSEKSALTQAEEYRAKFEMLCKDANIKISDKPIEGSNPSAGWAQEFGQVEDVLVRHARLCDVAAVPRPRLSPGLVRRSPVGRAVEAMLCSTGRPVLIEPPESTAQQCDSVAIGWNESTEASRAVAMTLPWLKLMSGVTVLSSEKRKAGAKDLVEYLSWHGIPAHVVYLDKKGPNIGDAMLNVCAEQQVGFLVVGGFSHARARELLFGGVTRHLLTHSSIPTMMVH